MRRFFGPLWFGLGLCLGALVGGYLVAASVRQPTNWRQERSVLLSERKVLWSMVEIQGQVIERCDLILIRLGLEP